MPQEAGQSGGRRGGGGSRPTGSGQRAGSRSVFGMPKGGGGFFRATKQRASSFKWPRFSRRRVPANGAGCCGCVVSAAALVILGVLLAAAIAAARDAAEVVDVYDGDTITVKYESGETAKIRLIGIDTPEIADNPHGPASVHGPVSRDYLDALLFGRRVELEYDVTPTDKYGRTLAYVYLPDGTMVNEQMVKAGYALLLTIPPNVKYVDRFTAALEAARTNNRGLWAMGGLVGTAPAPTSGLTTGTAPATSPTPTLTTEGGFFVTKTGKKYHRAGCRYLKMSAIPITEEEALARGYTPCSVCIGTTPATTGTATGATYKSSGSSDGRCEAITKKGTR